MRKANLRKKIQRRVKRWKNKEAARKRKIIALRRLIQNETLKYKPNLQKISRWGKRVWELEVLKR